MFIAFEKLDLVEMKINFIESIANLFVNDLFKMNLRKTASFNFSKGFCLFFSFKDHAGKFNQ